MGKGRRDLEDFKSTNDDRKEKDEAASGCLD